MNRVAVIDYGMGNLHSVAKALEHAGADLAGNGGQPVAVAVTADPQTIAEADRVVFPGVGAIRDCMAEIHRLDVGRMVASAMQNKPVLAICVGMQALMHRSEENGGVSGLGLLDGEVCFFGDERRAVDGSRLKVPHMGWNAVAQTRNHPLWQGVPDHSRFYFVHSYHVRMNDWSKVTGTTNYGADIVASLADNNIFATQFHPEKSQTAGLTLLRNFLQWPGGWAA